MYLGVKCVIAKNIARIHRGNLINHGIVPMYFEDKADYDRLDQEDILEIEGFTAQIPERRVLVKDVTKGISFYAVLDLSDEEVEIVLDGGQLRHLKKQLREMGVDTGARLKEIKVEA
jgi:aconitate hydratase